MHPQVALLIKEELHILLEVSFICPIDYLEWVSNIVPVAEKFGGIRV